MYNLHVDNFLLNFYVISPAPKSAKQGKMTPGSAKAKVAKVESEEESDSESDEPPGNIQLVVHFIYGLSLVTISRLNLG